MDLAQVIAGLLEGIFGSIDWRAFLFFCQRSIEVRHAMQVLRTLLLELDGSFRKEESRRFWQQPEQYCESIQAQIRSRVSLRGKRTRHALKGRARNTPIDKGQTRDLNFKEHVILF